VRLLCVCMCVCEQNRALASHFTPTGNDHNWKEHILLVSGGFMIDSSKASLPKSK